jgi:hypothetical protein
MIPEIVCSWGKEGYMFGICNVGESESRLSSNTPAGVSTRTQPSTEPGGANVTLLIRGPFPQSFREGDSKHRDLSARERSTGGPTGVRQQCYPVSQ